MASMKPDRQGSPHQGDQHPMTRSRSRLFTGTLLAVLLAACSVSVSTAHLGSLSIGAQKGFTAQTTTFGPRDTIYAQASADNLPNSVTLNWQVETVSVTGQASNAPIPSLDQSVD